MPDGNCGPLKSLLDPRGLIRGAVWAGSLLIAGSLAWSEITHDVEAADTKISDAGVKIKNNEKAIDGIEAQLKALEGNQRVMQNQLENDQRNNAAFQMRTEAALSRILEKLDNIETRRWDAPR
jgi:hypothetical protein